MAIEALPRVVHPRAAPVAAPRLSERRIAWLYAGTGVALFGVMGLAGLAMRLTQAEVLGLSPAWFYRLMTLHGAGMLTGAMLFAMGALWYVLRATVPLGLERMLAAYASMLVGALCVVVATLVGGYAAGWTFLWPLPVYPAGEWRPWANVAFLVGLTLVGVGFMVFCVDVLAKTTAAYGGLRRSLGIDFLRDRDAEPPPPQAIAAVVVAIDGLLASALGTTILLALVGRSYDGGAQLDPLWAKNLTYFFGHSFANLIIYAAVGAVYVLVPRFAGRPWKTTKPIAAAWIATLAIVATAYSHHLYMDFVQPQAMQYVSLVASFAAVIPVAVVTIYTGLMLTWGAQYRWTLASVLLYLGFAGWTIGGAGAVIDSLIPVNVRFHNTLWVVAHFHTYLMLGVILWAIAFVAYLLEQASGQTARRSRALPAVVLMLVGGYGLVGAWYVSGVLGLPRRYAVQPHGTAGYSLAGSIFVLVFAVGFLLLLAELVWLARAARERTLALPEPVPPELPAPVDDPRDVPLATPRQVALAAAAAVVALVSFSPQVRDAAEGHVQYHHLAHAGQFLLGTLVGLLLASYPRIVRRLGVDRPGVALTAAIAAPAAMLLVMVPRLYEPLETNAGAHAAYHLGMALLGVVSGLGAGRLGRVTGRFVAFAAVGMAVLFAAGVSGT